MTGPSGLTSGATNRMSRAGRVVVVLEKVRALTVHAGAVSFLDDALLARGGVPVPSRGVDGTGRGVMDQHTKEGAWSDPFHHGVGHRRAVIECAAVSSHVEHHL